MYNGLRVSVVIPAQDEEQAIGRVIEDLNKLQTLNAKKIIDQIVVCDNGSTDRTSSVAESHGAKVVYQAIPGYGIACLTAIAHLDDCDVVLFVDGDYSCDLSQSITLLGGISRGDDIAIGSRVLGSQAEGALTGPQKFGNWLSSILIRLFWSYHLTDLGPFRAIRKSALDQLEMKDTTFGWTVEMQVKAIMQKMTMHEYPVDSLVRIGKSKISGTVKGSILAGIGILSMIFKLRFQGTTNSKEKSLRAREEASLHGLQPNQLE